MQKEIFEQPRAVADTLDAVARHRAFVVRRGRRRRAVARSTACSMLACGTSYYSALVAKQWIESLARIPCVVEIASEYRYRDSVPNPASLVVVVSQSGETADTLAALKHAKASRARAHARDLQRRDELDGPADGAHLSHARRHRDRRRVDQGLHDAARRALSAGAHARQASLAADGRGRSALAARAAPSAGSAAGGARARAAGDRMGASASRKSSTRCSSGAGSTIRSRSRARSS